MTEYKDNSGLRIIREYEDHLDEGKEYEWPWPTKYTESAVDGDLAERVQRIAGSDGPVTLTTAEVSGGWSEYTAENTYDFELKCDGKTLFSHEDSWSSNGLSHLLEWLDKQEAATRT